MMKSIKKICLSAALICAAVVSASAQFVALNDHMGQPVRTKEYTDVKGSPYLYETWMKGAVTVAKGTRYEGVELMYDQVSDELVFKSEKGEAKIFVDPVKEFSFKIEKDGELVKEQVFRNGFAPIDGAKPYTFYEVLVDGQTKLLKRTSKSIFEEATYSSATKVKSFQSSNYYYLVQDNKLVKVKSDKKSILNALSDKGTELEAFIKSNRLDLKKDADLARLVAYYNSIKA
ncbi:hypothetical protein ACFSRY_04850 [Pontibacter locisalis]|uniref:Uncharacterized protein n=1 Tax=Pontibacter locisalis TaxID=1719035 RepID=A0ABW5IJR0_9BACT